MSDKQSKQNVAVVIAVETLHCLITRVVMTNPADPVQALLVVLGTTMRFCRKKNFSAPTAKHPDLLCWARLQNVDSDHHDDITTPLRMERQRVAVELGKHGEAGSFWINSLGRSRPGRHTSATRDT